MRALLLLASLLFVWPVNTVIADDPVKVEIVNEIAMPKDSIYNNALLWMAESFKSSKEVIDLKDKDIGVIISNGSVDINLGGGAYAQAKFKLKIDIKDGKYRLTFKDVFMVVDGYGKPIEDANRKFLEPMVTEKFNGIAKSLHRYLGNAGGNNDW